MAHASKLRDCGYGPCLRSKITGMANADSQHYGYGPCVHSRIYAHASTWNMATPVPKDIDNYRMQLPGPRGAAGPDNTTTTTTTTNNDNNDDSHNSDTDTLISMFDISAVTSCGGYRSAGPTDPAENSLSRQRGGV